ncbi:MAG: hypothetical protein IPH72_24975 [Sandaracinaceae bacterium]|nr:hypothetical protein [Sandaracinaceae bacterium]
METHQLARVMELAGRGRFAEAQGSRTDAAPAAAPHLRENSATVCEPSSVTRSNAVLMRQPTVSRLCSVSVRHARVTPNTTSSV